VLTNGKYANWKRWSSTTCTYLHTHAKTRRKAFFVACRIKHLSGWCLIFTRSSAGNNCFTKRAWLMTSPRYSRHCSLSNCLASKTLCCAPRVTNNNAAPPYCQAEMYAGRVAYYPLVSLGGCADGTVRRTDARP